MGLHLTGSSLTQLNNAYGRRDLTLSGLHPNARGPRAKYTMLTTFQSGHGWVDQGGTAGGSANLNDTSSFEFGSQSVSLTVPASGNRTVRAPAFTAVDLSAKHFFILVWIDDPAQCGSIQVTWANESGYTNTVAARPYTSSGNLLGANGTTSNGTVVAGRWTPLHFTWNEQNATTGTPDKTTLTNVQIRVNANPTTSVTVKIGALGYFTPHTAFPNGVVSFTFDDSYAAHWSYARPALDKYGWGGDAFLIWDKINTALNMTYSQLQKLEQYHGWSVCAHATTAAQHALSLPSVADPEAELRDLKGLIAGNGFRGSDFFALPKGNDSDATIALVKKYFTFTRTTLQTPFQTPIPDYASIRVRTKPLNSTMTLANAKLAVDAAVANGGWCIFVCHDILVSGTTDSVSWLQSDFQALVDYTATKNIPVRSCVDVLAAQT